MPTATCSSFAALESVQLLQDKGAGKGRDQKVLKAKRRVISSPRETPSACWRSSPPGSLQSPGTTSHQLMVPPGAGGRAGAGGFHRSPSGLLSGSKPGKRVASGMLSLPFLLHFPPHPAPASVLKESSSLLRAGQQEAAGSAICPL